MSESLSFVNWLNFFVLVQGILFGTMLMLLHSSRRKPTFFLGVFVLLFSLNTALNQELAFLFTFSKWEWLLGSFSFLTYPFLYLYIQRISILENEHFSYWTLIPGGVEFILAMVFFSLPSETNLTFRANTLQLYYYGTSLCFSIWIAVLILKWIRSHSAELKNQYAHVSRRKLNWAKWFVYLSIIGQFLRVLNHIQPIYTSYIMLGVFNIVLIYWVSFKGVLQKRISTLIAQKSTHNYLMTKAEAEQLLAKVVSYIENSKCYMNDKLTIIDLAEAIHIHPKRISYAINSIKGMHFNGYINFFRVGHAKELLSSPATEQLSIEGIGMEAGFHSKTTFYSAFKSFEGVTPAKYKSS